MNQHTTSNETTGRELLNCPFCGSSASMQVHFGVDHWVQCDNVDCASTNGKTTTDRKNALFSWNRRASLPPPTSAAPVPQVAPEQASVQDLHRKIEQLLSAKRAEFNYDGTTHALLNLLSVEVRALISKEAAPAPKFVQADNPRPFTPADFKARPSPVGLKKVAAKINAQIDQQIVECEKSRFREKDRRTSDQQHGEERRAGVDRRNSKTRG